MADDERPGILTLADLNSKVATGEIDAVLAVVPDAHGRLLGRTIPGMRFLERVTREGFLFDVPVVPGVTQPLRCDPELGTLRVAGWLDRTALVFCTPQGRQREGAHPAAARQILRRQMERASQLGYRTQVAATLTYYLFPEPLATLASRGFTLALPADPGGVAGEIRAGLPADRLQDQARRLLAAAAVPVSYVQATAMPGQYTMALAPEEIVASADAIALVKQCLRTLARQSGYTASFMALPHTGAAPSALHLTLTVWDKSGKTNLFAEPAVPGGGRLRAGFRAACLRELPALAPLFAPTVNSYKRWRAEGFLSTEAPEAGWLETGADGSSLRVILAGADANPYLVFAGILGAGLQGIESRAEQDIEGAAPLPGSLSAARALVSQSALAATLFADDALAAYLALWVQEQEAFDAAVTDWERSRYLADA